MRALYLSETGEWFFLSSVEKCRFLDSGEVTWKNFSMIFSNRRGNIRIPLKINELISFQEAINSPNNKELMEVMRDENGLYDEKQVWELADLPSQRKYIVNKSVFKIKFG